MDVFFIRFKSEDKGRFDAFKRLLEASGVTDFIGKNELIGIKLHIGEKGNNTHIEPGYIKHIVSSVKAKSAKPFLTETNVLYVSQRNNAVDHILLAHGHGFSIEKTGAPFILADGLLGTSERTIAIKGKHYKNVPIASMIFEMSGILVVSHLTGHMIAGFGGAIKNLGMGFSSRKGKMNQHSTLAPYVKPSVCTKCEKCITNCPENAITLEEISAVINPEKCIGCGECIAVCSFRAIGLNWQISSEGLQERMAEHALGVLKAKEKKLAFINILCKITKDCDCVGQTQKPVCGDIGALCSFDPVAIDQASCDLIKKYSGKTIEDLGFPHLSGETQLSYGERIGLGSRKYNLIEVK